MLDGAVGASASAITGAGDWAFVSGWDLKELAALRTDIRIAADDIKIGFDQVALAIMSDEHWAATDWVRNN